MSHLKTHEQYQRMTRGQVAGELRRLAAQLESAHAISYGDGQLEVPEQVEWDLEIDQSADGATLLLALKVMWPTARSGVGDADRAPRRR
jgi:hypothetical protein